MFKTYLRPLYAAALIGLPLVFFGASAQAQTGPCTTAGYSTTYSTLCSGNPVKASSTVTSAEATRAAVAQTGGLVASRVGQLTGGGSAPRFALAPDQTYKILALGNAGQKLDVDENTKQVAKELGIGLSAGAEKPRFGIWADGAFSRLVFSKVGSKFNGEIWTGVVGVDYAINDWFTLGVAGAYEDQNFDTGFNRGTLDGDGFTAAPYAVFKLHKNFSLDVSGGYAWLDYDTTRKDPITGTSITGSTDANRWFGSASLNADYWLGQFHIGGKLGTLYAREKKGAFTESNSVRVAEQTTNIGDIQAGVRLGYMFKILDGLEPYVSALGRYAYQDGGSGDSTDVVLGAGLSLRYGRTSFGVQGTTVEGRDNTNHYSLNVNARIQF